jgi:protein-L-isoaspartate O-methyltransferase
MDANHPMFPPERRQFHLDRYAFAQDYCAGKTVLDGACGTGYGSALLGERAARVVGIDRSQKSVSYATHRGLAVSGKRVYATVVKSDHGYSGPAHQ